MPDPRSFDRKGAWPIWVVSLPDATERRRAIRAQLDALGLPSEYLQAHAR